MSWFSKNHSNKAHCLNGTYIKLYKFSVEAKVNQNVLPNSFKYRVCKHKSLVCVFENCGCFLFSKTIIFFFMFSILKNINLSTFYLFD